MRGQLFGCIYRQPSLYEIKCAKEWINRIHLGHKRSRPLRTHSCGEQRLVLITWAMIKRSALLVLAEPCLGLDAMMHRMFLNLINHIGESSGTRLLYVSHRITDRVSCIHRKLITGE